MEPSPLFSLPTTLCLLQQEQMVSIVFLQTQQETHYILLPKGAVLFFY